MTEKKTENERVERKRSRVGNEDGNGFGASTMHAKMIKEWRAPRKIKTGVFRSKDKTVEKVKSRLVLINTG